MHEVSMDKGSIINVIFMAAAETKRSKENKRKEKSQLAAACSNILHDYEHNTYKSTRRQSHGILNLLTQYE